MGWIVSNAPYSYPEVKAALYPIYRNKELLLKKIAPYKADIIKEKACQSFAVEASNFSDNRQYDSAYKMIDFAMTIANAVNDTFGKAAVHLLKAQIDQDLEKYADAIKECDNGLKYSRLFKNAYDTSRYMEFKENEARLLIKKGFCQYKISLYKDANRTLEEARMHLENNKTVLGEALYAGLLVKREEYVAMINYNDGNYVAALSSISNAISINDRVNSTDSRARNAYNYWLKGKIYNQQKNSTDALSAFSQSKSIYAGRNDELNMAIVLNEVGYTYYNLAEYRKSIACLDTAYQRLYSLKDYNSAGYSKSLTGNCYWEMGMYDSAISAHQEAISLRKDNESGLAYSWEQLGSLYKLSGLKDKAMDAYKEALMHNRQLGDSTGVAGIFKELGILYHNDEFYSMAVSFYERAAKITPEVPTYALYNLDKDSANGNNGKLTMDEIEELDIEGCDLVTLSACETAVSIQRKAGMWRTTTISGITERRSLSSSSVVVARHCGEK
ncbi:tetratricopeptide repeat protein [Ostertagia ostertagi]